MSTKKLLVMGISGVTCGGKTTTATELNKIMPGSKMISQDDYFFGVDDERHTWIPELNHINYDIVSSLDMEKMHSDIMEIISNYDRLDNRNKVNGTLSKVLRAFNGLHHEDLRKTVFRQLEQLNVCVLIVEGFCIFNYKPMQDIFDLKYYFTLDKEECFKRRVTRVYDPPDCPGYFDLCVWPEHLEQLNEIKRDVADVKYFSGKLESPINDILKDVLVVLGKSN